MGLEFCETNTTITEKAAIKAY
uniref:Uncharacterized protein n=1 Tax=Arundo donax TaxID=35708 RepID=A0A0A9HKG6_ARUDO